MKSLRLDYCTVPADINKYFLPFDDLHNYLRNNLILNSDPEKNVWLIMADIDNLKKLNQIYGKKIVDILLDNATGLIINTLIQFHKLHENELKGFRINIVGDDIRIVTSATTLPKETFEKLLEEINKKLAKMCDLMQIGCFTHRTVSEFARYENIDESLLEKNIVIDPNPRRRGLLFITKKTEKGTIPEVFSKVKTIFSGVLPCELTSGSSIVTDWLFDENANCFKSFNNGKTFPIHLSFAIISNTDSQGDSQTSCTKRDDIINKMVTLAEEQLKTRKLQKKSANERILLETISYNPCDVTFEIPSYDDSMHTFSTIDKLRQHLDSINGLLVHIEPIYDGPFTSGLSYEQKELFRGNEKGVGIKGLNSLCSGLVGANAIKLLEYAILKAINDYETKKDKVSVGDPTIKFSKFVDKFEIIFYNKFSSFALTSEDITNIVVTAQKIFNKYSKNIQISQFIMCFIIVGANRTISIEQMIEFTRLSDDFVETNDGNLIIKLYHPEISDREGKEKIEQIALSAARNLL